MSASLVGSEMCIRDSACALARPLWWEFDDALGPEPSAGRHHGKCGQRVQRWTGQRGRGGA
eukprot:10832880-Alexandrium_andersonii.AAC.1